MTAEKYKVSYQGKEIWQGMALSENFAKAFARTEALGYKDTPVEELTAEVIPFDRAADSPPMRTMRRVFGDKTGPEKRGRRTRVDKGIPRKKERAKNRRTNYYLILGEVHTFTSKDALDAALTKNETLATSMVITGGTLRSVECRKRFVLK